MRRSCITLQAVSGGAHLVLRAAEGPRRRRRAARDRADGGGHGPAAQATRPLRQPLRYDVVVVVHMCQPSHVYLHIQCMYSTCSSPVTCTYLLDHSLVSTSPVTCIYMSLMSHVLSSCTQLLPYCRLRPQAVRSGSCQWRSRLSPTRRSSSWTSRPPVSTRTPGGPSGSCCSSTKQVRALVLD